MEIDKQKYLRVCVERTQLCEENARLKQVIADLKRRGVRLSYNDLRPGGVLGGSVQEFTFLPDFGCNDAFLDVINNTDGCEPGEGLCENMVRYQEVTIDERREFQTNTSIGGGVDDMNIGDGVNDMSIGDDAGTGLASIIDDSNELRS